VDEHRPDLVIVDPLANFHTGDENVARDMSRVTTALDDIRGKGVAVALVHHHGKGSSSNKNVGHKARGSSVLPGWYDSHMSLQWAEPQRTVRVCFELRNGEAPEDMILKLNPETLLFEQQTDEASQVSLVVSAVRQLGRCDAEAVGAACGKSRQWASDWLNRAVAAARIIRFNQGRSVYYVVPYAFGVPGQVEEEGELLPIEEWPLLD
jgi:hypothetical protein